MDFLQLLSKRILVLDGAVGTSLLAEGCEGSLEALNLTAAERVEALHHKYIAAGADIVTTNTFCADALSLSQYGLAEQSYHIARAGAQIARRVADAYAAERKIFVAGSVGPTTRNLTLATDTSAEQVAQAYAAVASGLIDGGVDIILVESAMDVKNVRLAVEQVRRCSADVPIIVSAVLSRIAGRVASGATVEKFLEQLPLDDIAVVGFNCSGTPSAMEPSLKTLCAKSDKPIIFYPSAGEERLAANNFAKQMEGAMRERMVNIVGGCCGTTPQHIEALARRASRWQARRVNI